MSFGVMLPNFVSLANPESLRIMATRAEELGFDHLWFGDHIIMPTQIASAYPYTVDRSSPFDPTQPILEPLATLCYLAGCTQRIKLGPFVLVLPYREPIFTAKILSTLDYMSGGRLILGVGVGWMEEEFKALGLDTFKERGKVTDEYIRIYKELWTKDSPEFQGQYSQFSGFKFYPRPVQKPHPPIWVGGNTTPALRRAATLGDCWVPVGLQPRTRLEPKDIPIPAERLRDMTEQAGRPRYAVDIALSTNVVFDPRAGGSRRTMTGTAEEIAADIVLYQQAGVQHFVFALGGDQEGEEWIDRYLGGRVEQAVANIDRFAKDVLPQVA